MTRVDDQPCRVYEQLGQPQVVQSPQLQSQPLQSQPLQSQQQSQAQLVQAHSLHLHCLQPQPPSLVAAIFSCPRKRLAGMSGASIAIPLYDGASGA